METKSSKISIIVPVYKVEKELSRCVDSLIHQTYGDIEIILVDDASPDSCPALCDKWAEEDPRIRVIHKEKNEGLGFARNSGLEIIGGDYVMFVDSDDYIDIHTCELTLKTLSENSADACFFSCGNIYDDKPRKANIPEHPEIFEFSGSDVIDTFLVNTLAPSETSKHSSISLGISSCMALYDARFFRDGTLRFCSERDYINEDLIFRIQLCKSAEKIVMLQVPLYFYCHRGGSLSTSYKENHFSEIVKMYEKCEEEISDLGRKELRLRNIRYFMINLISVIKKEIAFNKNPKDVRKRIRSYCKNETLQKALREYPVNKMPLTQKALFCSVKMKAVGMIILLTKLKLKQSQF